MSESFTARCLTLGVHDAVAIMNAFDGDVEFVRRLATLSLARAYSARWTRCARRVLVATGSSRARPRTFHLRLGRQCPLLCVDELSRAVETLAGTGGPVNRCPLMDEFVKRQKLLSEFVPWTEMLGDVLPSFGDQR